MKTIAKSELAGLISAEMPELKEEVNRLTVKENIGGLVQIMVTFTKDLLKHRKWTRAKWNMLFVGWLYERGDASLKNMVENIYVRSFHSMQKACGQQQWAKVYQRIPQSLLMVYKRQSLEY